MKTKLQIKREEAGLTREELAELAYPGQSWYYKGLVQYGEETGFVDEQVRVHFAQALKCPVADLVEA